MRMQMMELFRARYANADGSYTVKPWYKPKAQLKLDNVDHNFHNKQNRRRLYV